MMSDKLFGIAYFDFTSKNIIFFYVRGKNPDEALIKAEIKHEKEWYLQYSGKIINGHTVTKECVHILTQRFFSEEMLLFRVKCFHAGDLSVIHAIEWENEVRSMAGNRFGYIMDDDDYEDHWWR